MQMSPLLKKASFDSSKCITLLELTLKRIKILKSKRLIVAKQSRDDVAKLLQKSQEANAVARVEYAFREQNIAGAYDLLEQYCQLIIKRISAIKSQQECPSELKEAVASLIYAAPRCGDLQELQKLRDVLTSKFGAEFTAAALELQPESSVNQQIIQKLSSCPPNSDMRLKLLKEIATEYRIDWNYEKAVAASFKSGETSIQDKKKMSTSPSHVSKGASLIEAHSEKSPTPISRQPKEQAGTIAQNAPPSKSKSARANQAFDVAQHPAVADIPKPNFDSLHRDGGHKNQSTQNTSLSTHNSSPKPREFVGASKKPIVVSPSTADKERPLHKVSSREKESVPAHADAIPLTIPRGPSRQVDFMGASDMGLHAGANKQKSSSMYVLHDECKGQPSIANFSPNSKPHDKGKGFSSPSYMGTQGLVDNWKPVCVAHQDGLSEKAQSASPSWNDNKVLTPEIFVNRIQVPNVSMQKLTERKSDPDKLKGQAISTQDAYEARAFAPKLKPQSLLNHETNGAAESLAAKQYMRAHKSYVKEDTSGGEEDHRRSMENSGFNQRRKHGAQSPHVDPYARLRQEGKMDYKNAHEQVEEPKRTSGVMDVEEDSSLYEYYAREQPKGTYLRRGSYTSSHEGASLSQMSKEKEWEGKNSFSPRGRHQIEESSFNHRRNRLTLPELSKGYATQSSTHAELGHDLTDLEAATESAFASAIHAADVAKAAIDMLRTSSVRSKAGGKVGDVKASQREAYLKTSFGSSRREGHINAEGIQQGSDAIKDEHEWKHSKLLSAHAEMTSIKAEARDASGLQKKTVSRSTQDLKPETRFYETSIRKNQELINNSNTKNESKRQENNYSYTEAHQEQESELYDLEMPQFDDYSSYESGEEDSPFYTKGRAAIARKVDVHKNKQAALNKGNKSMSPSLEQGLVNFVHKSVHLSAQKNLQQDFSGSLNDDNCAESVEFLSADSYNAQFDDYEQSNNGPTCSTATPMRSHVSGLNTRKTNGVMTTYHQEQQGQSLASYGYSDEAAIRWGPLAPERPTRDVSKQRWTLTGTEEVNAKPPLQAHLRAFHDDYPALSTQDSQAATGKHFGMSRQSVRSSRLT